MVGLLSFAQVCSSFELTNEGKAARLYEGLFLFSRGVSGRGRNLGLSDTTHNQAFGAMAGESRKCLSCSRATLKLHRGNLEVALEHKDMFKTCSLFLLSI